MFAPLYLPTYLTAYARSSEGYIRVKSSTEALGHCPVQHTPVLQGPLSCQVAVTVVQPGGNWVPRAPWNLAVVPRSVSQNSGLLGHKEVEEGRQAGEVKPQPLHSLQPRKFQSPAPQILWIPLKTL